MIEEIMNLIKNNNVYQVQKTSFGYARTVCMIEEMCKKQQPIEYSELLQNIELYSQSLQNYETELKKVIGVARTTFTGRRSYYSGGKNYLFETIFTLIGKYSIDYGIPEKYLYIYTAYNKDLLNYKNDFVDLYFSWAFFKKHNETEIRKCFREKSDETVIEGFLLYKKLFPQLLTKYAERQVATYNNNDTKSLFKVTDGFEQRIFELSLPSTLNQNTLKNTLKNFERNLGTSDFFISLYNVSSSILTKYPNTPERFVDFLFNKMTKVLETILKTNSKTNPNHLNTILNYCVDKREINNTLNNKFYEFLSRKSSSVLTEEILNTLWRMFREPKGLKLMEKILLEKMIAEQRYFYKFNLNLNTLPQETLDIILENYILNFDFSRGYTGGFGTILQNYNPTPKKAV